MKIHDFCKRKKEQKPVSMVTCYDSWSAALIAQSDIDCVLVGDSIAMTLYGFDSTLPADTAMIARHTAAVRRGMPEGFIIADLPFLSYRCGLESTMQNVASLMRAGASAVKLEGAAGNLATVRHIVESGVPVMGHLGLTPQSHHALGGFRVQGKNDSDARRLLAEARELQQAGCFSLVLEAVPRALAAEISRELEIPVIGIGAGTGTDGQVLVLQDLLGLTVGFKPRFVRSFMPGAELVTSALQDFHQAVSERSFPVNEESYR